MIRKCLIAALLAALFGIVTYGQFADCSTGLLQMPTAEMQDDGTFMITNNYLNSHSLSPVWWGYSTFQYGIYLSLLGRMEIGYVCTLVNDNWKGHQTFPGVKMINQDRHFVGRICFLREGEFGLNWLPALVVGGSDPFTGAGGDYLEVENTYGSNNGFFNRFFCRNDQTF